MKKNDMTFWALAVSFVFGATLHWPVWARIATICLSITVLAQICRRLLQARKTEE